MNHPAPATAYLCRGIAALMKVLPYKHPSELLTDCETWWKAWEQHPNFKEPDKPWKIFNVTAAGVWEHEPGRGGNTESYLLAPVSDIVASKKWGERTWGGRFTKILPIWQDAPLHPYRITMISTSYKGAGGAATARQMIKAMMPKEVRPWVTKMRHYNSRTKYSMCGCNDPELGEKRYCITKKHICNRTKAQIVIDDILPEHIKRKIRQYMTVEDFWLCCTGQVNPNNVLDHLHPNHGRQLSLKF